VGRILQDSDFDVLPTNYELQEFSGATFAGRNTVDLLYRGAGKLYIGEAKGGSSQKGTRIGISPGLKGKELTQGTLAYLNDIAFAMTQAKSGNVQKKEAGGLAIQDNIRMNTYLYIGVRGDYDTSNKGQNITTNPLKPEIIFKLP
jgi:hypothetical protein